MPHSSVVRLNNRFHPPPRTARHWYRFADGYLALESDDHEFNARLTLLYRECHTTQAPDSDLVVGRCQIKSGPQYVAITFTDLGAFDPYEFSLQAQDLECEPTESPWPGWRAVTSPLGEGVMAFFSTSVRATPLSPWRSLVGAMLLVWILSRQSDVFCFHAASVSVRGDGVLMIGRKEAGKTTLSVALGARGHGLLSDEIGAFHAGRGTLLPFRRLLNIRSGPAAPEVMRALEPPTWPVVVRDDGTSRVVVHASDIVPQAPAHEVPLSAVVMLADRTERPRLTRFAPSRERLADLTPHESCFWRPERGLAVMRLLSSLIRVPWFTLSLGTVPATVDLLEGIATEL